MKIDPQPYIQIMISEDLTSDIDQDRPTDALRESPPKRSHRRLLRVPQLHADARIQNNAMTMAFIPTVPSPNVHQTPNLGCLTSPFLHTYGVGRRLLIGPPYRGAHNLHRDYHHPTTTPSTTTTIYMSGVNGGIDYDIDLSLLPSALSSRVRYVQQGPDSPTELINAAEVIASSVLTYPSVLPVLVDMLGFNNPVAASICVSALASAGKPAIPPLLTGVAAFNYSVNAYALRALALIGDPNTIDVCTACAVSGPIPNVRRAACKALGALRFTKEDNEGEDSSNGNKDENGNVDNRAQQAFDRLLHLAQNEPDWGVRYAAIVAVEQFWAIHLLDAATLRRADDVLREAAGLPGTSSTPDASPSTASVNNGTSSTDTTTTSAANDANEDEGNSQRPTASTDPAVRARATVAVKVFKRRIDVVE